MPTQMVRKQIYISKRQESFLKKLADSRGVSEAEIVRQALDRELSGQSIQSPRPDHSAWEKLVAFLDARNSDRRPSMPYRWDRSEIYEGREGRWLRDRDEEA